MVTDWTAYLGYCQRCKVNSRQFFQGSSWAPLRCSQCSGSCRDRLWRSHPWPARHAVPPPCTQQLPCCVATSEGWWRKGRWNGRRNWLMADGLWLLTTRVYEDEWLMVMVDDCAGHCPCCSWSLNCVHTLNYACMALGPKDQSRLKHQISSVAKLIISVIPSWHSLVLATIHPHLVGIVPSLSAGYVLPSIVLFGCLFV